MSDDEYEDRLGNLAAYNVAASDAGWRIAYFSGPDLYRADAEAHGAMLKGLCARYMLHGLWPLDCGADPMDAKAVFAARTGMIRRADVVVANIAPFRGPGLAGGTAWEIGFAAGLGKPVYAYTSDPRPYDERAGGIMDGLTVTPSGMIDELMVAGAIHGPFHSAETALYEAHIRRRMG